MKMKSFENNYLVGNRCMFNPISEGLLQNILIFNIFLKFLKLIE